MIRRVLPLRLGVKSPNVVDPHPQRLGVNPPGGRNSRMLVLLIVIAAVAALLVGYRPSLSPLGLHARGDELAAARAEVLVDTADSEVTDIQKGTAYNSYLAAQLSLGYVQYLKSFGVAASVGRALGLRNESIASSGPFTLLLDRTNYARKPPALIDPRRVDHHYRLLVDIDGGRPMISLYSQAPTVQAALTIVESARTQLLHLVVSQEATHPLPAYRAVILRPLGSPTGGVVERGAGRELMAFVFGLIVLIGGSLMWTSRRRQLHVARRADTRIDVLDDGPPGSDDWPHTRRVLPWSLTGFLAMLFLVPFDAIQLPVHLPVNSSLDRPVVVALGMLWFASLLVTSGAARPRVTFNRVHFATVGFLGLCCLSVALNAHALANLSEVTLVVKKLALLSSYIFFFFIASSILRPREISRFAALIVILGVVVGVCTIIEYRTHYNVFYSLLGKVVTVTPPKLLDTADSIGRLTVYGPTQQPLELAALLAMVLPFALVGAVDASTRRQRVLYVLAVGLLIAAGVATARKTSLVVPLAVMILLIAHRPRLGRTVLKLGVVLVVLVHLASPAALGSVISELEPGHLNSALTTTDRTARYDAVVPDVLHRPLLGRGYESYDPQKYRILDNQYLDLLITTGAIGVLGYLAIFGAMMTSALPVIRGADPRRASLALAAYAAVAAIAIASALFDTLSFPHVPYLLFFVAAMITTLREPLAARVEATVTPRMRQRASSRSRRSARSAEPASTS